MKFSIYQADAFANTLFGGNPATVCPLQEWLPDNTMQKIAAENNLSETAFFVKENEQYSIRWFTPKFEIDLRGHATLASAFIIFSELQHSSDIIHFTCKSSVLNVKKKGHLIELDFPSRMPAETGSSENLSAGFNITPQKVLKSRDYFLVYNSGQEIKNLISNFNLLNQLDVVGIIVTAKDDEVDFVSRFFVPNSVIGEDPVTGSSHCSLIPYWSRELNKETLTAKQLSKRGASFFARIKMIELPFPEKLFYT